MKAFRFAPLWLGALLAVGVLAACEPSDNYPGQPVTHRRQAFRDIMKSFEAMGVMLRQDGYRADRFIELANQYNGAFDKPWQYFGGPDTRYPPSTARAEIWTQAAQFEERKQAFLDASRRLVDVAGTRDEQRIADAYEAAHAQCEQCHKRFKDK